MTTTEKRRLRDWVAAEQVALWNDLDTAIRHAINGVWSIECHNYSARIIKAAQLVGPTNPHELSWWRIYRSGVYGAVLDAGRVLWIAMDGAEVNEIDNTMERHRPHVLEQMQRRNTVRHIETHPNQVRPDHMNGVTE